MTGNIGSSFNNYNSIYSIADGKITQPALVDNQEKVPMEVMVEGGAMVVMLNHDLNDAIEQLNPGNHSIVYGDNIYYVSKLSMKGPLCLGMVDLTEKAIAKGGFGKIYNVVSQELIFKLSRKKLKSRDKNCQLIPLNAYEKKLKEVKGSSRGLLAKNDLLKEYEIMQFIKENAKDTTGLNCYAYSHVFYKNQVGIFIKKFDCNALDFVLEEPSMKSRIHLMNQLFTGLHTLHQLNIIHRDIKLENTLIKYPDTAAISDFGNACVTDSLFKASQPYPELSNLLGSGTQEWISAFLVKKLEFHLNELSGYEFESSEYEKIKSEIVKILKLSDFFSMSVQIFTICTGANPPFKSIDRGDYFEFDSNLSFQDKTTLIDEMRKEICDAFNTFLEKNNSIAQADYLLANFIHGLDFGNESLSSFDKIKNPSKKSNLDVVPNDDVMNLVKKIKKHLHQYDFQVSKVAEIVESLGEIAAIAFDRKPFNHIAIFYKNDSMVGSAIIDVSKKKFFARGGYGKIYNAHSIDIDNGLVFKLSRKKLKSYDSNNKLIKLSSGERLKLKKNGSRFGIIAREALIHEFEIMRYIKKNAKSTTGLNCHAFSIHKYKNQFGMLMKKFDFNGLQFLNTMPSDREIEFISKTLTAALNQLHDLNICHRDIKLENILLRDIKDSPNLEVVLSDFGNACDMEELFKKINYPTLNDLIDGWTVRYVSNYLSKCLKNKLIDLKKWDVGTEKYNDAKKEITRLLKECDHVSLGLLIYELWTGGPPPKFQSFKDDQFFKFNDGLNAEEKRQVLQDMEKKIYKSSRDLPESLRIQNCKSLMRAIVTGLELGENQSKEFTASDAVVDLNVEKCGFTGVEFLEINHSHSVTEQLSEMLFEILEQLHDLNICHRDIRLENVLVVKEKDYLEVKLNGNTCNIDDLFAKINYPTLHNFIDVGTICYASYYLVDKLHDSLIYLRKWDVRTTQYDDIKKEITRLLKECDRAAMGILMYELWSGGLYPPFKSFANDELFEFDEGLNAEEKRQVLLDVKEKIEEYSSQLSKERQIQNSELVVRFMEAGLDLS